MTSDPRRLGGVKIPSERSLAISSRHHSRSASEPLDLVDVHRLRRQRAGEHGERLRGRRDLARDVALRHRPLLDAEDRLAGLAVQNEEVSILGADADRGDRLARRGGRRTAPAARRRRNPRDRDARSGSDQTTLAGRRRAGPRWNWRSGCRPAARRRSSRGWGCRWGRTPGRARDRRRSPTRRWRRRCAARCRSSRSRPRDLSGPAESGPRSISACR